MKKKKISFLFFIIIFIIVLFDQSIKFIVKANFRYITNPGSLWGLFPNATNLLIWLSFIIIGIFLFYYEEIQKSKLCQIGSGLVVGGAIGNLIDRILYKAVIDFINLKFWPLFNIADSAISIGIILLIIYFIKD
jgi:signal peptidase II